MLVLVPAIICLCDHLVTHVVSHSHDLFLILNLLLGHTRRRCRCDTVMRNPNSNPDNSTVHRPADLRGQQWFVDPEYYWFFRCQCMVRGALCCGEGQVCSFWHSYSGLGSQARVLGSL